MKRDVSWSCVVSLARSRFGWVLVCPRLDILPELDIGEDLVEELAQHLGGSPDRRLLVELLTEAGREIETLAGRSFQLARRATSIIYSCGLPMVDVPDLGRLHGDDGGAIARPCDGDDPASRRHRLRGSQG